MIFIALVNYAVIITSPDIMELAKDFTALCVISEFGKHLASLKRFQGLALELLTKKKYKNLLKIETTTSLEARGTNNIFLAHDATFERINKRRIQSGIKQHIVRPKRIRLKF